MTMPKTDFCPMPDELPGVPVEPATENPTDAKPKQAASIKPERTPPQDIDAEKALLGAMMMDRSVIDEVASLIPDRAVFFTPQHAVLYDALLKVHSQGSPMDLIVVSSHLQGAGLWEIVGGKDYIMQLAESFADWANAPHYARIIVAKWQRRELIRLSGEISKSGYDDLNDEPGDDCAKFQKKLDDIADKMIRNDVYLVQDLFEKAVASLHSGGHGYLPCGVPAFDQKVGGLQRPGLTILAGRPSTGKTTIAMNMLYRIAWDGVPGMLISAEMENLQVALRTLCALTGDTIGRLKDRASQADASHTIQTAHRTANCAPVYINDQPKTLRKVVSAIRSAVRKYKLGVVAVDYLQLLRAEGRWDNKNAEVTEISNTLAKLSKELGIALILLCQLNRDGAGRDGQNPPTDENLRDSGSIEQDADQIVMLYPVSWAEWRRTTTPLLALDMQKNRNGPTCDCTATFDKPSFRLSFSISESSMGGTSQSDLGAF